MSSALQQLYNPFKNLNGNTAEGIQVPSWYYERYKANPVLDKLFGGEIRPGLRPCTAAMISAVPGGGKTTLLLQYLSDLNLNGYKTAYFSNEQILPDLADMCNRLNINNVPLYHEKDVDIIIQTINENEYDVVAIDSFNGLTTTKVSKNKREYATVQLINRIWNYVDNPPCSMIMVVHALADGTGAKAGGSDLSHAVDLVMHIKKAPIKDNPYGVENVRELVVQKNRTGDLQMIAMQMTGNGYDFSNPLEMALSASAVKEDGRGAQRRERYEKIMNMFENDSKITLEGVIEFFNCSEPTARNDLRALETDGKIKKIGRGQSGWFEKV